MTRRPSIRQADIDALIRSALACGLEVAAVEMRPDGAVRVLTGSAALGVGVDGCDWVALAGQSEDETGRRRRRLSPREAKG
jgi:hypothetical protein